MPPKTILNYYDDIKSLHPATTEDEQKKLDRKISEFVKRLDITVFVASNEQLPYSEKDLGFNVQPMILKDVNGFRQVGDLQAYYSSQVCEGWVGLLVERKGGKKGCEDLYGTLMSSDNCSRFYREIDRFQSDPRFNQMVVLAECTFEQFLLYNPPFLGSKRNTGHVGANVEARRGKITSLYARGVPVLFCGSRHNAIETYKSLIRQWLIKNYAAVLGLEKTKEKPLMDMEAVSFVN